ncbi:hypothetical protein TNCV_1143981 [Trichonephila clavipes]|nr:hypothetical protein TNCV_1143981 [Trichonephila clavipes]
MVVVGVNDCCEISRALNGAGWSDVTPYDAFPFFVHSELSRQKFLAEIVEVEIGGVAIYRPFGELLRAKSYCHLHGAQGQRYVYF